MVIWKQLASQELESNLLKYKLLVKSEKKLAVASLLSEGLTVVFSPVLLFPQTTWSSFLKFPGSLISSRALSLSY